MKMLRANRGGVWVLLEALPPKHERSHWRSGICGIMSGKGGGAVSAGVLLEEGRRRSHRRGRSQRKGRSDANATGRRHTMGVACSWSSSNGSPKKLAAPWAIRSWRLLAKLAEESTPL